MTLAIYHRPTLLPSLRKPPVSRGTRGQIIAPSFLMQRYFTTLARLAARIKKKNSLTLLLFFSFFLFSFSLFFSLSLSYLSSLALIICNSRDKTAESFRIILVVSTKFFQKEYKIYSLSYLAFRDEYLTKLVPLEQPGLDETLKIRLQNIPLPTFDRDEFPNKFRPLQYCSSIRIISRGGGRGGEGATKFRLTKCWQWNMSRVRLSTMANNLSIFLVSCLLCSPGHWSLLVPRPFYLFRLWLLGDTREKPSTLFQSTSLPPLSSSITAYALYFSLSNTQNQDTFCAQLYVIHPRVRIHSNQIVRCNI